MEDIVPVEAVGVGTVLFTRSLVIPFLLMEAGVQLRVVTSRHTGIKITITPIIIYTIRNLVGQHPATVTAVLEA